MIHYVMAIDATKCMNCKACVVACQQRNGVPYGHSRNWIRETSDRESPSGLGYQPGACMHCDKPLCVDACPTRATYKAEDGSVRIDRNRCIGCGSCVEACPYDARFLNPRTGTADKCDYCASTMGLGIPPACVLACPTHCRIFGNAADPDTPVAKALANNPQLHVVSPRLDTKPTLTYLKRTAPLDWPREARVPAVLASIAPLAMGVRWLGGLTLLGLIGVFLRNLLTPSPEEHHTGTGEQA